MKLMIDDIDYSEFTDKDSVIVRRAERMNNLLQAELFGHIADVNLSLNHEVRFYGDDGGIIFAGELLKFDKKIIGHKLYRVEIQAHDYEHILTRRSAQQVTWTGYAGDYIRQMVTDWLVSSSEYSENITVGNIEKGAYLTNYTAPIMTFWGMFNEFAKASGFTWYIDMNKALHFTQGITSKFNGKVIDLDDMMQTNAKIYDLSHDSDITDFATRVYVVGKERTQLAGAINTDTEKKLKTDYFSGVVGKIIDDYNVETLEQSETVAKEELKKYGNIPFKLHFFTTDSGFRFSDLIKFKSKDLGVPKYKYYTVTQAIYTFQLMERTITEVYADVVDANDIDQGAVTVQYNQKDNWTEAFNQPLDTSDIKAVESISERITTEKITEYDTGIHTNIHCRHEYTEENVLYLFVEDESIKSTPPYGCYHFTLNSALEVTGSKITVISPEGEVLVTPKPWLLPNMNMVTNKQVSLGARVQVIDNGDYFFSNASGGEEGYSYFQVAVAKKIFTDKLCLSNCVAMRADF